MRLSYRSKLLGVMLGLVVVTEGITVLLLARSIGNDLLADLDARLVRQAWAATTWLDRSQHPERLAPRVGALLDVEVAIVGPDGALRGQSEGPALPTPERLLPEILGARAGKVGRDTRWSASRGAEMRYVAVATAGGVVLRLGVPMASLRATLREAQLRILLGAGIALALAVVLGSVGARLVARPLREMALAAKGIADGRPDVVLPPITNDDVGRLSLALGEMARTLDARMAALRAEEASRREFLADASHELRTPLSIVQAHAERLAARPGLEPPVAEALATIQRHTERMGRLVTDLLRLSSLEARSPAELELVAVPLAPVVAQAQTALTPRAGTRLTVDVPAELLVVADEISLEHVIENLIDNALKYAVDAAVRVRGRATPDGTIELVVEDDGPGIPAEHLAQVFARFYRVDKSRTRVLGGSGLGLAIVRRLVELMGGRIDVESPPGQGARFVVRLRRAPR